MRPMLQFPDSKKKEWEEDMQKFNSVDQIQESTATWDIQNNLSDLAACSEEQGQDSVIFM